MTKAGTIPQGKDGTGRDSARKADKKHWSRKEDGCLLDLLCESRKDANAAKNRFSSQQWTRVMDKFLEQFPQPTISQYQFSNHAKFLKKKFENIQAARAERGLGWDSTSFRITAAEGVWTRLKKDNAAKYEKYHPLRKGWPLYPKASLLYKGYVIDGRNATSGEADAPLSLGDGSPSASIENIGAGKIESNEKSGYNANKAYQPFPPTHMSPTLNAQLIEAVESGNDTDVQRLIEAGASPNARKKVTIRARVWNPLGGFEWKKDSVNCESALVLAVLHSRVEIARLLLEKGAMVDGVVRWKISNWFCDRNWTLKEWQQGRWIWTCSFPSVLALGMGHGGKCTSCYGYSGDIPNMHGKLDISRSGGTLKLKHPVPVDDIFSALTIHPNIEIIRLLLKYGARFTDVELAALHKIPSQNFLSNLVAQNCIASPWSTIGMLVPGTVAYAVKHLTQEKSGGPSSHARKKRKAASDTAELRARIASLDKDNASLHQRETLLLEEIAALHASNSTLQLENKKLRSDISVGGGSKRKRLGE
ncbi:hypothetical protein M427DRAFT_461055 [Gonapodya prolifera JEL478]|uniref:Myb/SANT-like domain-containing protein n=1 Tax=Gonapodya prolifera (strain JEL478) TaxID=1344416 RepID=A0A139A1Z3_GONPJ|nr:hypothetical protein M427DRAFT_461055 [Gonapodya prolifera JEL478]|eukprot:KXS10761.1 hypothetical protein M427DRAFT_461055 [Gonapodya prolifera JEL478]